MFARSSNAALWNEQTDAIFGKVQVPSAMRYDGVSVVSTGGWGDGVRSR